MANKTHISILKKGTVAWNPWRKQNPNARIDLHGADLRKMDLSSMSLRGADFRNADLHSANLERAYLPDADFRKADLSMTNLRSAFLIRADLRGANLFNADLKQAALDYAKFSGANLRKAILYFAGLVGADLRRQNLRGVKLGAANLNSADLRYTDLRGAFLCGANLNFSDLSGANLDGADLQSAFMMGTNLTNATLTNCWVYGTSVWDVMLRGTRQSGLIITRRGEPVISVDNLEVAQFIYILLYNEKIRHVINTITSKVVLILGRFTQKRKAVLDAIREELRKHDYLPVLFDFEKPRSRDYTETVSALAHLSRFIIADITSPKSIPQELQAIVPTLTHVPIQPLLQRSSKEYGMFRDFKAYSWVLPIHRYKNADELLKSLDQQVITPAEAKAKELEKRF